MHSCLNFNIFGITLVRIYFQQKLKKNIGFILNLLLIYHLADSWRHFYEYWRGNRPRLLRR